MPVETATHEIVLPQAPVDVVDALVHAEHWPVRFPPTIAVDVLSRDESGDRLRIWALAGESVRSWETTRRYGSGTIGFEQSRPAAPLSTMRGDWTIAAAEDGAHVVLRHAWEAPESSVEFVRAAVEENSTRELRSLAETTGRGDVLVRFDDSIVIAAAPAHVLELIWAGEDWPQLLPHVLSSTVRPLGDDEQELTMEITDGSGARHTTRSIRVRSDSRVLYKQIDFPPQLAGHAGAWVATSTGPGTRLTSTHLVSVRAETARALPGSRLESALRDTIGRNSQLTMARIKARLESGR